MQTAETIDDEVLTPMPPLLTRTTAGLRDGLFDILDGIRQKTIVATEANAFGKNAQIIVESFKVDIEAYKLQRKLGVVGHEQIPSRQLGELQG